MFLVRFRPALQVLYHGLSTVLHLVFKALYELCILLNSAYTMFKRDNIYAYTFPQGISSTRGVVIVLCRRQMLFIVRQVFLCVCPLIDANLSAS